jgi:predicted RNA-binding protein YlxR (DUF448 family)
MSTAAPIAREDQADAASDSTRRCIVTGEVQPKDDLIRFVTAPGGIIVADLERNLPGRGLWLSATREAIEAAARKGLFAKAAKAPVKADPDLADKVALLMAKRCFDLLGLSRGAGIAVLGQPQVEAALKGGKLGLLLIANDAAANGIEKIGPVSIACSRYFNRNQLGAAFGHDQIVYAGLKKHALAQKLRHELGQLVKIAGDRHLLKDMETTIQ